MLPVWNKQQVLEMLCFVIGWWMLTPNHRESWKVTFDFVVQQVFVLLSTVFYISHLVIHATKLKLYELKTVWQSSIVWNSVAGRRFRSLLSDQCHDMQTCLTAEFRLFHVVAYILITLKSTVLKRKCQIDCIIAARGILQSIRTFWGETTINVGSVRWRKGSGIITNSVIKKSVNSPYCMNIALDNIVLPETQRQNFYCNFHSIDVR